MTTYRFEFREDFSEESVEGIDLVDDEAAKREAVRTAREIMTDGILEGIDRSGWVCRIVSETGHVVTTIRFSDLIERRGHLE